MGDCNQQPDKENCCPDSVHVGDCPPPPPPPAFPYMGPGGHCYNFPGRPHHGNMHPFPHPPPVGMPPFHMRGHCHRGGRGAFGGRMSPWHHHPSPDQTETAIPYLYYADNVGLAEQVRLCFVLGNVSFVDKRITPEEWQLKYKSISPSGTMPFMTVGNSSFSQSRALLLYAARRGNLIPSNMTDQMQGLTLIGLLSESLSEIARVHTSGSAAERGIKVIDYIISTTIPSHWVRLNSLVQAHQAEASYALGNGFTYVDAAIAGSLYAVLNQVKDTPAESQVRTAYEQQLPVLKKIMDSVYADPRVIDFMRKAISNPTLYYKQGCWRAAMLSRYMDMYALKYQTKVLTDEDWNKDMMPILPWIASPYTSAGGFHACFEWIEEWLSNRDSVGSLAQLKSIEERAKFTSFIDQIVSVTEQLGDGSDITAADRFLKDLSTLSKLVTSSRHRMGYIMGDSLTFLDVMVSVVYERLLESKHNLHISTATLKTLRRSAQLVCSHPSVKQATLSRQAVPKLYYFAAVPLLEGCRLMFHVAGMPYEDVKFGFEEWKETYKSKSLTGRAPWIEIDGAQFHEISVVSEMVGELTSFVPETFKGRYAAKQILSYYVTNVLGALRSGFSLEAEKREAHWVAEITPLHNKLEELIKEHQTHELHAVESTFTYIDFFLAGAYELAKATHVEKAGADLKWPVWKKIRDAVYALPEVQDYVVKASEEARCDPYIKEILN